MFPTVPSFLVGNDSLCCDTMPEEGCVCEQFSGNKASDEEEEEESAAQAGNEPFW